MNFTSATTTEQIQQVALLAKEIWTEHFTPIISAAQVAYMLQTIQSKEAITEQIRHQDYRYYLLEESNQPIGYCAVILKPDALFLSKLYLRKTMRGKGLAKQAVEFVRQLAIDNGLNRITLTCNKNNTGPIAVYEKLGFVNIGPIVADIGGGFIMDDYQMQLDL